MNTADQPGELVPPEPGTRIGEVALFYTEGARAVVPSFDLELVPLSGKNPGIGGLAWQSHASSEMSDLRDRLKGLGPSLRRVDGWGALMNRFVAFDVDHPEAMSPELTVLVIQGLFNETRPGRGHWIFRVPVGARFGGRKDLINERYPALAVGGDGASWGEIKGFNSQVRIWSPNADGSHVRLVPGEIPMLPPELMVVLMEPEFYFGDPLTSVALDDWLDDQTGAAHPDWLAADIAKLPDIDPDDVDPSKNRRLLRRVYHVGLNVAAGMYQGREAYERLHEAWVGLCIAEGDYITDGSGQDHERKYRGIWRRAVGKLTCDPGAQAAIEEKRLAGGGGEPWDPEHNEGDRLLDEYFKAWAAREGVAVGTSGELSAAEMTALLSAIDPDDEEIPAPEPVGGQVFDMAEMVAARLARLEAQTSPAELPPEPQVEGGLNGDEEIRGSSVAESDTKPGTTTPDEVKTGDVGSATAGPPEPPSAYVPLILTWDNYLDVVHAESLDAIKAELKMQAIKEVAGRERRIMSGVGDITAVDFDDLDDATVTDPPPGLMMVSAEMGLLYEDAVTMLIGDKTAGKSWLMAAEALVQMRLGRTVAWLDWEMNALRLRNRLRSLGATSADVRGRWRYLGMHGAEFRDARKALDGLPPGALVVVDSVSQALGSGGSDEDKASDYGPWIAAVKLFRAEAGCCAVLIDHTGHTNKTRARGSSAKGQQADVEFTMAVVQPWSRTVEGWASLACRKDRGGHLKLERPAYGAFFQPGMRGGLGSGSLDVAVRELNEWEVSVAEVALLDERERAGAAKKHKAETERREAVDRVLAVLADGARHSRAEVVAESSVPDATVRGILDALLDEGRVVKVGTSGPKSGWRIAEAVDESEE